MPADPTKIALYMQGTFDIGNPDQQQQADMLATAKDIGSSGFGTVLLGQWHVRPDGSIYYNDTPLDDVLGTLEVIPKVLKDGGSVREVLLTFGPFGTDFQYIKDNLEQFKSTIVTLQENTVIDGLDWDLEEDYESNLDLLVNLTKWANDRNLMVTAAPYIDMSFWIEVLKKTNPGGSTGFSWWNLQLYGGASYPEWVSHLNGLVANPEAFLVPGYSVTQGVPQVESPSYVENHLKQLHSSHPSVDGAFIWRYEDMEPNGYSPTQYAAAIARGLGSASGGADSQQAP